MSDYIITPNGMVPVSDDVLMHWKYIKRVKKNGKWRYYYDEESLKRDIKDKLGYDERERLQKANKQYEKAVNNAKKADTKTSDQLNKFMNNPMPVRQRVAMRKAYDDALKESEKATKKAEKAYEKVEKLKDEYSKTPIGKANEFVQKGENFFKTKVTTTIGDKTYTDYVGEAPSLAKKGIKFVEDVLKKKGLLDKKLKDIKFNKTEHLTTEQAFEKAMDTENTKKPEIPTKLSELYFKTKDFSVEEDQAATNPNYDWTDYAYSHNCALCTAAYDLRLRGYEVEAAPMTDELSGKINDYANIAKWYEGTDTRRMDEVLKDQGIDIDDVLIDAGGRKLNIIDKGLEILNNAMMPDYAFGTYTIKDHEAVSKALEKEMLSYGEGARGFFSTAWTSGSAHASMWIVENGEVVIRDAQVNETVKLEEYVKRSKSVGYFRTDNLKPTDKIAEAVRNDIDDNDVYKEQHDNIIIQKPNLTYLENNKYRKLRDRLRGN